MERKAERIAALLVASDRLARKFEASDLTAYPKLAALARDWLLSETQPREEGFLLDMWLQANQGGMLTLGQLKGVLNTIVARERFNARPRTGYTVAASMAPVRLPLAEVKNGRYRVEFSDGSSIAVRLSDVDTKNGSDWAQRQPEGTRGVAILIGADDWQPSGWITPEGRQMGKSAQGNVAKALEVLANADDTLVYGQAFARLGNVCFICGRNLDTAESIDAGYGPVCADKYGLPWGAKVTPVAVQAAREAAPVEPHKFVARPHAYEPRFCATCDVREDLHVAPAPTLREVADQARAAADAALDAWSKNTDDGREDELYAATRTTRAALKAARAALEAAEASAPVEVAPEPTPAPDALSALREASAAAQVAVASTKKQAARRLQCQNPACGMRTRIQYLTDPKHSATCALCDQPGLVAVEERTA
jgi:Family of unknown function (DUF6011)